MIIHNYIVNMNEYQGKALRTIQSVDAMGSDTNNVDGAS